MNDKHKYDEEYIDLDSKKDKFDESSFLIEKKVAAYGLFDIMQNASHSFNSDEKEEALESLDQENLRKIADHTPVNTLMLEYYLEQLSYQPVFEKKKRDSLMLSKEKIKQKQKQEWILIQLRTTLILLAHAAIIDAKLGKPIQHWLDKIEHCYNQIERWNLDEAQQIRRSEVGHHIHYLALLLGYQTADIQRALANPGIGLLKIDDI